MKKLSKTYAAHLFAQGVQICLHSDPTNAVGVQAAIQPHRPMSIRTAKRMLRHFVRFHQEDSDGFFLDTRAF